MTSQDSGPMSSLDGPEEVGPVRPAAERMAENLERETQLGPHFWSILGAAVAVFLVGALVAYLVLRPRPEAPAGSGSRGPAASAAATRGAAAPGTASGGATSSAEASANEQAVYVDTPPGKDQPLHVLSSPPPKTISMTVVPAGVSVATFKIDFEPYGWGQGGQRRGRLVAHISAAKTVDVGSERLGRDFTDTNVAVWASPTSAEFISAGGLYSGVMRVQPQGDVGLFYLSEVTARK